MDWFFFKLFNKEEAAGDDEIISILMLSFSFVVLDAFFEPFVSSVFILFGMFAGWGKEGEEVCCDECKSLEWVVFVILSFSFLIATPEIGFQNW